MCQLVDTLIGRANDIASNRHTASASDVSADINNKLHF